MPLRARYDGYADWYEGWNKPHAEHYAPEVRDLLGPGRGRCLDLGCGGGHYFDVIAATGRAGRPAGSEYPRHPGPQASRTTTREPIMGTWRRR